VSKIVREEVELWTHEKMGEGVVGKKLFCNYEEN